jgi:3-hydroxyisobutyrate dehydrogenase-like beta-hydroxyacid dehydrogenase
VSEPLTPQEAPWRSDRLSPSLLQGPRSRAAAETNDEENDVERVGFVGLGAIGWPMAHRLLVSGFEVAVFDIVPERSRMLVELGAVETRDPEEAALYGDVTIVMVATGDQALEAIFGDRGVSLGLSKHKILVLTSSVGPKTVREIDQRLGSTGAKLLDAPVSGGTARARIGDLLIMVSGEEYTLTAARPVLEAMGSKIEWISQKVGDGQSMKLVNQLLCGVHLAAAGEALAFARALGLNPRRSYEVVRQGAANSFMLDDRAGRMLSDGPVDVESALDIFVKDTGLVLDAAQENGFQPDLAITANKVFREGSESGMGREDDSRVEAVYRNRKPSQ